MIEGVWTIGEGIEQPLHTLSPKPQGFDRRQQLSFFIGGLAFSAFTVAYDVYREFTGIPFTDADKAVVATALIGVTTLLVVGISTPIEAFPQDK